MALTRLWNLMTGSFLLIVDVVVDHLTRSMCYSLTPSVVLGVQSHFETRI